MFDADKRHVRQQRALCQHHLRCRRNSSSPARHMQTIIAHRCLARHSGRRENRCCGGVQLAALGKHSTGKASSRVDKLADGRLTIKVTRGSDAFSAAGSQPTRTSMPSPALFRLISAISSFRDRVESVLQTVSDCTTALKSTATDLFGSSEQTSLRAKGIVQASQGASTSVGNAAEATRQMSDAASQIGQQIDQTNNIIRNAVGKVRTTNDEFVGSSSNAAQKIGDACRSSRFPGRQICLRSTRPLRRPAPARQDGASPWSLPK